MKALDVTGYSVSKARRSLAATRRISSGSSARGHGRHEFRSSDGRRRPVDDHGRTGRDQSRSRKHREETPTSLAPSGPFPRSAPSQTSRSWCALTVEPGSPSEPCAGRNLSSAGGGASSFPVNSTRSRESPPFLGWRAQKCAGAPPRRPQDEHARRFPEILPGCNYGGQGRDYTGDTRIFRSALRISKVRANPYRARPIGLGHHAPECAAKA